MEARRGCWSGLQGDLLGRCAGALCPRTAPPPGGGRPRPSAGHGRFGEGAAETAAPEAESGPVADRLLLGHDAGPSEGQLAALAHAICGKLEAPRDGSHKRLSLLLHRGADGGLVAEVATAAGGARAAAGCSAEAAALARLLLRRGCCEPLEGVERLVSATDGPSPAPPSPRSCELLLQHLDAELPVVCTWRGGEEPNGRGSRARISTLGALYPHPDAYRRLGSDEVADFAAGFALRCAKVPHDPAPDQRLFQAVFAAAREEAKATAPACCVHLAAGVLYKSGALRTTSGLRGAGPPAPAAAASGDAVLQLAPWVAGGAEGEPELLLICDQWGVLHAPSGAAREQLVAFGLGEVRLLVHQASSGELCGLRCMELLGERACGAPAGAGPGAAGA